MVKCAIIAETVVNSSSSIRKRRRKPYISSLFVAFAFRSLLLSSVRPSVRATLSRGGKPPHREPSQLPYIAIDYCNYNILYHTPSLLCEILLHNVLYYHTLCAVLKCENIVKSEKVKKGG